MKFMCPLWFGRKPLRFTRKFIFRLTRLLPTSPTNWYKWRFFGSSFTGYRSIQSYHRFKLTVINFSACSFHAATYFSLQLFHHVHIIPWELVERRSINIFSAWVIRKLVIFYDPPFNVLLRSRFSRYDDSMLVMTSAYDNNRVSLMFAISIFLPDSPVIPDFRSYIASPRRRTRELLQRLCPRGKYILNKVSFSPMDSELSLLEDWQGKERF